LKIKIRYYKSNVKKEGYNIVNLYPVIKIIDERFKGIKDGCVKYIL